MFDYRESQPAVSVDFLGVVQSAFTALSSVFALNFEVKNATDTQI